MSTIHATFTNPNVIRRETPDGTWFLSGSAEASPASIAALMTSGDGAAFCEQHGNALVVHIQAGDRPRITMWKALFSTHETWFAIRPNRDIVISDHFRNTVAALPVGERSVSDEIIGFHFLTRKVYGSRSYLSAVTRLAHGTEVDIDPRTGTWSARRFDRVGDATEKRPPDEYLADIGARLTDSLGAIRDPGGAALLFSGGVDSTLVLALDPDRLLPVTFVPDTKEFAAETEYARRAAALLDKELVEVPIAEGDFVTNLEAAVDRLGFPPFDDASPYFDAVLTREPHSTYVFGLGADSAFGMSLKLAKFSNWFRYPGVRHALEAVAPITPGHLGYRLRQVSSRASALAKQPLDPMGFAGTTRNHGDTSLFTATVGPELPRMVNDEQLSYVIERVEGTEAPRRTSFLSHIEIAHWMTVFGNPLHQMRMVTNTLPADVRCPYVEADVLRAMARIPLEDRYVLGYRAKWILKDLLKQKVPEYPVDQRKKATALPWQRFYEDGPLAAIWTRYDVPDFFPEQVRRAIETTSSITTWNAITWSMWDARVRRNPDLTPHPPVESLSARLS